MNEWDWSVYHFIDLIYICLKFLSVNQFPVFLQLPIFQLHVVHQLSARLSVPGAFLESSSNAPATPVWGLQKLTGTAVNQRRSSIGSCSSMVAILCLVWIYFWYAIRRFSLPGYSSTSKSSPLFNWAASWTLCSSVSWSGSLNMKFSFWSSWPGCPWVVAAASSDPSNWTGSGSLNLNNPLCSSGTMSFRAASSDLDKSSSSISGLRVLGWLEYYCQYYWSSFVVDL